MGSSVDQTLSRRTLAKGAVWAVPAVAAAAAAPVYACSPGQKPGNVRLIKNYETCGDTVTWVARPGTEYKIEYRYRTVSGTSVSEHTGETAYTPGSADAAAPLAVAGVYQVRVSVAGCEGMSSDRVGPSSQPPVPSNVKVTRAGTAPYDYRVTWNALSGASLYQVNGWTLTGGHRNYFTPENHYEKTNSSRPLYRFRVRALVCGVWSGWSGWYNRNGATSAP